MKAKARQYQLDLEGRAGIPEPGVISYDDQEGMPLGLHDSNLFDQDETRLGGYERDEATGNSINNSLYTGLEGLRIIAPQVKASRNWGDVLSPIKEDNDAAAEWLAQNESLKNDQIRYEEAEREEALVLSQITDEEFAESQTVPTDIVAA